MDRITGDGKAGARNVFLMKIGKHLPELSLPLRMFAGDLAGDRPCLPDAEIPNPVKSPFR
jgi:hypothetical protein